MAMPVPPDPSTRWRPAELIIAGLLIFLLGETPPTDALAVRLLGGAIIFLGLARGKL